MHFIAFCKYFQYLTRVAWWSFLFSVFDAALPAAHVLLSDNMEHSKESKRGFMGDIVSIKGQLVAQPEPATSGPIARRKRPLNPVRAAPPGVGRCELQWLLEKRGPLSSSPAPLTGDCCPPSTSPVLHRGWWSDKNHPRTDPLKVEGREGGLTDRSSKRNTTVAALARQKRSQSWFPNLKGVSTWSPPAATCS